MKRHKQSSSFSPDRTFINQAIQDYLKRGGEIKKIIPQPSDYAKFLNISNSREADSFLKGEL